MILLSLLLSLLLPPSPPAVHSLDTTTGKVGQSCQLNPNCGAKP